MRLCEIREIYRDKAAALSVKVNKSLCHVFRGYHNGWPVNLIIQTVFVPRVGHPFA